MARSERQEDGARAGAGTVVKTGRRPVQDREPEAVVPAPGSRWGRRPRPVPPRPVPPRQSSEAQLRKAQSREAQPRQAQSREALPREALPREAQSQQAQPRQPELRQTQSRQAQSRQAQSRQAQSRQAQSPQAQSPQAQSRQAPPRQAPSRVTGPQPALAGGPGVRVAPPVRTRPGGAPWRVQPTERGTGPQPAVPSGPQPSAPKPSAPKPATAQPSAPAQPDTGAVSQATASVRSAPLDGTHRMPFVLLLCALLGGALVCALVISTTLAQGSFQLTKLQDSTNALARQQQALQEQVAQAQSAQVIAEQASKLGMRRPQQLLFLDLKTGKTSNDGPTWSGADNAPGYAP